MYINLFICKKVIFIKGLLIFLKIMTLYLIGLGLWDEKDITLKAVEILRNCRFIYLESYTSILNCSVDKIKGVTGKNIQIATRQMVESDDNEILEKAKTGETALLVIGDPFGATTHIDLVLRAKKEGIKVVVINNASILNAVGITGLELYKFGKTTSIPFHNENVTAPVDAIMDNKNLGLHTLVLLDLDPSNGKFMLISEAADYLLKNGMSEQTQVLGLAAIGSPEPEIRFGTLEQIKDAAFEKIPQCMIIIGKLHFKEEEALEFYSL